MIPVRSEATLEEAVEEYRRDIVHALLQRGVLLPAAQRQVAESRFWHKVLDAPHYYMNQWPIERAAERVLSERA